MIPARKTQSVLSFILLLTCAHVGALGCGRVGFGTDEDAGFDAGSDTGVDAGDLDAGVLDASDGAQIDAADAGPRFDLTTPFVVVGILSELGLEGGRSPTTTADQLQLYFERGGNLFGSVRAAVEDPWDPPAEVTELASFETELSPAVAPDGLTVYFSSLRSPAPELDVFSAIRSDISELWSVPLLDVSLSSFPTNMEPGRYHRRWPRSLSANFRKPFLSPRVAVPTCLLQSPK